MLLDWQRTGGGPRCRPLLRQRQASEALSGAHWACGGSGRPGLWSSFQTQNKSRRGSLARNPIPIIWPTGCAS